MKPVGQPERTDGPFAASILPVQLTYALQPIVDVHSGVVYAYEALLRGTEAAGHASIDVFLDDSTRRYGSARTEIALHELAMLVYRRLPHPDLKKLFLNV
ncbi:MAG TPA: hypothetical protein VMP03_12825, partial [Methylomirabilota bacterium]|nr:hypothetical protein [Methylomirabilota bacterium]